jgi:hypothetical protein
MQATGSLIVFKYLKEGRHRTFFFGSWINLKPFRQEQGNKSHLKIHSYIQSWALQYILRTRNPFFEWILQYVLPVIRHTLSNILIGELNLFSGPGWVPRISRRSLCTLPSTRPAHAISRYASLTPTGKWFLWRRLPVSFPFRAERKCVLQTGNWDEIYQSVLNCPWKSNNRSVNSLFFMEPVGSLPCSQKPVTDTYRETDAGSTTPYI